MEIETAIGVALTLIIALCCIALAVVKTMERTRRRVSKPQPARAEEQMAPVEWDESHFMPMGLMPATPEDKPEAELVDYRSCGNCGKICKDVLMGFNEDKQPIAIAVCPECDCQTESVLEIKANGK